MEDLHASDPKYDEEQKAHVNGNKKNRLEELKKIDEGLKKRK